MGLAIPNDPLKSVLLKDGPADYDNRSEDITLSLFSGSIPLQEDMKDNLRFHSDGWAYFDTLLTWITTTHGSVELLRMEWADFVTREHIDATKMRYNISKRSEQFDSLAEGVAGWFILSEQDESTPYTSGVVRWAIVGTVGIEGSGADLIIPDVNIVTSKKYRGNDIVVDFNVQGSVS